jgi:hypothetical protein
MAPVLFLFLMQAFAETLEDSWEEAEIEVPTYNYHPNHQETSAYYLNKGQRANVSYCY